MSEQDRPEAELLQEISLLKQKLAAYEQGLKAQFQQTSENIILKSIINAVPHAIVGLADRKIVFANNAVKNVFNIDADKAIGQTTRMFYRSDADFKRIAEMFYPILEGNDVFASEFPCRTFDGRELICRVNAARLGNSLEDKRIVVMYEDITERKANESAHVLFRNLIEQSQDSIEVIEAQTARIIDVNKQGCLSLGYTKQELLAKTIIDIDPLFDADKWKQHIQALQTSPDRTLDTMHLRKDGTRFPVEVSIKLVTIDEKQYLISLARDISDRKAEQRRLLELNKLKESLLKPGSLEDKLKLIIDKIVDIFDAGFVRIWLIKPGDLCNKGCLHADKTDEKHICKHKDKCLHLIASSGIYSDVETARHKRVPFDCYKIGKIASGEDLKFLTNDVAHDPKIHDHQWIKEKGLISFAGYRIMSQGDTAGVFALFSRQPISPGMDTLLENTANTIGQIIQAAAVEKELIRQNSFLKTLIESLVHPFYVINTDDYSIALANSYAYKSGNAGAKKCYELTHKRETPCDGIEHLCPLEKVKQSKAPLTVEHVHYDQQGERHVVEINCYPILNDCGQVKQVIEYSMDISERKKAEAELKQSASDWHRTFDAISDLVFIQDANNVIVRVNKACANYLGMGPDQIEGRKCYDLWHKKDSPWESCPMELTKKDNETHTAEVEDENIGIPLRVTTSPIFDENKQMIGSVHIAKDITQERLALKELKRKMHDLEIFRKSAIGREMKMLEMKKKIKDLENQISLNNEKCLSDQSRQQQ